MFAETVADAFFRQFLRNSHPKFMRPAHPWRTNERTVFAAQQAAGRACLSSGARARLSHHPCRPPISRPKNRAAPAAGANRRKVRSSTRRRADDRRGRLRRPHPFPPPASAAALRTAGLSGRQKVSYRKKPAGRRRAQGKTLAPGVCLCHHCSSAASRPRPAHMSTLRSSRLSLSSRTSSSVGVSAISSISRRIASIFSSVALITSAHALSWAMISCWLGISCLYFS